MNMLECASCGAMQYSNLAGPDSCSVCGGDLVRPYRDIDEALSLDPFFDANTAAPGRAVLPTCPVNDNEAPAPVDRAGRVIFVAGAAVAAVLFLGAGILAAGDMERCQRLHSFDTCFSALNR